MRKIRLQKVTDYHENNDTETTRLGFVKNDVFITNPFTSDCGRFEVDPKTEYGLTDEQIHEIDEFNYYNDPEYMGFREEK